MESEEHCTEGENSRNGRETKKIKGGRKDEEKIKNEEGR